MEAETFSLLKSFQQEKIISVQFSLWLALLWLKDQLFKKLWLCPKSCHINPEPTVYFYKHVINLTDWPGFVTGTLPHFHSPCFLISMYWGLKAQLYFQLYFQEKFVWCSGQGSLFSNPPAELQASASEWSPLTNSASHCHTSVLLWL